jgi:uncharacterized protein
MSLPALAPFLAFAPALRGRGLPASSDQVQSFLSAVSLLGPRDLNDVRRAAHAVYGPGPERTEQFDAVFDEIFLGRISVLPGDAEADEDVTPPAGDESEILPEPQDDEPSGADATTLERLQERRFADDEARLGAFVRALPRALPHRISRRFTRGRGVRPDPARTLRELLRRDGELVRLQTRQRRQRQRPVLLLIDVSGSMKAQTDSTLRLAHAVMRGAERAEVFTLGTRLTRVTTALRTRAYALALERAAALVSDWDGGTRLGDALERFVAVPRFAAFSRGALVVVVSDGLERGGPETLVAAVRRLRGLARHILWLSPLAADPDYRPQTQALRQVLPLLDHIGNGASLEAMTSQILNFASEVRR